MFNALIAVVILGESFAWYHPPGGLLVPGGIYLATVRAGTPRRRSAG